LIPTKRPAAGKLCDFRLAGVKPLQPPHLSPTSAPAPGVEIQQAMTKVRAQVNEETNKGQLPWGHTNLTGAVHLNPAPAAGRIVPQVKFPDRGGSNTSGRFFSKNQDPDGKAVAPAPVSDKHLARCASRQACRPELSEIVE
jgi:hypothetical protein